jgi:hypothetical protein
VITEIASAIHVRHILTPIRDVRWFSRTDRVGTVKAHLDENLFDFTPIFPGGVGQPKAETAGGLVGPDGLLCRSDLSKLQSDDPVGRLVRPLTSGVLIEAKASLNELIERFGVEQPFMLVVGGGGLEGVVTPSDLNKQAGRTQLFMQVCAVELALADRARASAHSEDELLARLPGKRARAVRSLYKKQRERDEAADLVAALDFQDVLYLFQAQSAADSSFGRLTGRQIQQLSRFRNTIMHAVLEPAGDDDIRLKQLLTDTRLVAELLACVEGPSVYGSAT